jgi:rubredoxin
MPQPSNGKSVTRRFQAIYNHDTHLIFGFKDLDYERNEMATPDVLGGLGSKKIDLKCSPCGYLLEGVYIETTPPEQCPGCGRNHRMWKEIPDTVEFPFVTDSIHSHEGKKYLRSIHSAETGKPIGWVDVYEVLLAFNVTDPAVAHAIKKLLACGQRGKGDTIADLKGAIAAIKRAINFQERKDEQANSST